MFRFALSIAAAIAVACPAFAQVTRPIPPRIELAAPAERPVELRAARVVAEIAGGLAYTTVEMAFHNPNPRVLEGELQFPLLDGQSVVGFALDVDGRMRDAVPVEKSRGQAVFEDITRARADPGLLQVTEGNNYKLRVYPIPPQGERRVLLRYMETLTGGSVTRHYRLPLAYAGTLREFSLELRVAGAARPAAAPGVLSTVAFERDGEGWRAVVTKRGEASGVLDVEIPQEARPRVVSQAFADGIYFRAESPARERRAPRALPRVVQIVWDASGSLAGRDWRRESALLGAYFSAARAVDVRLVKVRDIAEPVARFEVRDGDWSALRRALEDTVYDGATNLAGARPDPEAKEILLFSDGLANFGDGAFAPGATTVYAISSTPRVSAAALRRIAESGGGRFIDLTADSDAAARDKLLRATTRVVALEGDGVDELVMETPFVESGRLAVAGKLRARHGEVRATLLQPDGTRDVVAIPVVASDREGRLAATVWAAWRIAALEADAELNRAQIRRLGRDFALVTRETSLIVLERVEDYARYEIEPPRELAESYGRLRAQATRQREADSRTHLERIVKRFEEKQAWWDKDFPKDDAPKAALQDVSRERAGGAVPGTIPAPVASASPPARMMAPTAAGRPAEAKKEAGESAEATTIRLRPWKPDAPYATRMREAAADRAYRVYLDERPDYVQSSAFFLDAADILFEKGRPELAVRVLSNLAEMDLENRQLLRILGYRLLQASRPELALGVFRKVLALAPDEPQSYRDLGLAHAALKQLQLAVDRLCDVVMKPWPARFPDIEVIALAELNAVAATAGTAVDTSCLDPRLARNLPLDLRVILTWDADNTDLDLWVTDPNGEKAFYGHQLTYQGGRMSLDVTGGYGPEEFSLRKAKPGTYKVEANFYGHRQQVVAGATTLQVKLTTGFGTPRAEERIVTLRLKGQSEVVYVGDFEVR